MAVKAPAKPPVAGQTGYDPFKASSAPEDVGQPRDLGPETVQPKPKRETPPIPEEPATQATGKELLAHLLATGTPMQKLDEAREWLAANPTATAEKTFRYMEEAEEYGHKPVNIGTLRKAGKFLWGATWEPESAVLQAPADEIRKLRQQVATLEMQLSMKNSEKAAMAMQIAHMETRLKELGGQVDYLKVGRNHDDLSAAGVTPADRNVTVAA